MRTLKIFLSLGIALFILGCVPSLHPLYTDKELVFNPALVGTWLDVDDEKDTWTFRKSEEKAYKLIQYQSKGDTAEFEVHLVQLGEFLFLDTQVEGPEMINNDFYRMHFIPGHIFSRVRLEGDNLSLAMLDPDSLKKMIEEKKADIGHELFGDDGIVLTAPTAELQKFMLKSAGDTEAFGEPMKLKRQK